MSQDATQRRRIAAAAALTVVLVPASYLLFGSDNGASSGDPATVTSTPGGVDGTDVMGTVQVGYLSGDESDDDGEVPVIAIPRAPNSITAYATYNRDIGKASDCLIPHAPFDAELTITNTDTGRRAACNNGIDPNEYADRYDPDEAILHIDTYLAIADLTDSPVPIEVTW